jgi:hypothetical protein
MPIFDPLVVAAAYAADPNFNRQPTGNELARWQDLLSRCPLHIPTEQNKKMQGQFDALLQLGLTYTRPEEKDDLVRLAEVYRLALPIQHRSSSDSRIWPDEVLRWVRSLVDFYVRCGGKPGVGVGTPCSRFISAVAADALKDRGWTLKRTTIGTLIQDVLKQVRLTAADHVTGPPEIGSPKKLPENSI